MLSFQNNQFTLIIITKSYCLKTKNVILSDENRFILIGQYKDKVLDPDRGTRICQTGTRFNQIGDVQSLRIIHCFSM